MTGFFITGTGTDVGKTFFTALLTRSLRARGIAAHALKPIVCGERTDAEIFAAANEESLSLNEINPVHLAAPLAPYTIAVLNDALIDLDPFWKSFANLKEKKPGPFLVEGAGGWRVPITRDYAVADLARDIGLPVIVVASAGLGTINHTLLTVDAIRRDGLPVAGLVLNHHGIDADLASQTNAGILEDLTGLPLLELQDQQTSLEPPPWLIPPETGSGPRPD